METWDALRARRQTRNYLDAPVRRADIDRVLEAGRRSPSGHNSQPWHFVVVVDAETKSGLSRTWQGAAWAAEAPVIIAILCDTATDENMARIREYDLGQAVSSMLLAATDLGLGSGQTAVLDQELARELLGFPEDVSCSKLVTLGPVENPPKPIDEPDRRSVEDIVHEGRW